MTWNLISSGAVLLSKFEGVLTVRKTLFSSQVIEDTVRFSKSQKFIL
jgi:hypothetical protein